MILEARSLKSRCQQGHTPSEVSKGESFLASFRSLVLLQSLLLILLIEHVHSILLTISTHRWQKRTFQSQAGSKRAVSIAPLSCPLPGWLLSSFTSQPKRHPPGKASPDLLAEILPFISQLVSFTDMAAGKCPHPEGRSHS